MGKEIDEKTLQAAKEKLACKIQPATYADASSAGVSSYASDDSQSKPMPSQPDFIGVNGEVLLTRMTAAGG